MRTDPRETQAMNRAMDTCREMQCHTEDIQMEVENADLACPTSDAVRMKERRVYEVWENGWQWEIVAIGDEPWVTLTYM